MVTLLQHVVCSWLMVFFILGVAFRTCGTAAKRVAHDLLSAAQVSTPARIVSLTREHRTAGEVAVAPGCFLVDGACECDVAALHQGGAEADAISGMA